MVFLPSYYISFLVMPKSLRPLLRFSRMEFRLQNVWIYPIIKPKQ